MLFASTSLAARIERAECGLLEDCATAISRRREGTDVQILPIAGGVATYTGPGSPLNKVAGLGFEGPVDGASMRIGERVAQLCGAATLPAYRRRGVQSALLASRLSAAGRAGCDIAVVTTQPGSKSQQNVQRRGFEPLYTRAILVLEV